MGHAELGTRELNARKSEITKKILEIAEKLRNEYGEYVSLAYWEGGIEITLTIARIESKSEFVDLAEIERAVVGIRAYEKELRALVKERNELSEKPYPLFQAPRIGNAGKSSLSGRGK
jgi:hypothetical protein